jgi:protein O-GlcNAc transferase
MDISELIRSALHHYQSGNLPEAERSFLEVLKHLPDNAEILCLLGIICGQLGKYEPAIHHLKKALHINPANADACFALGVAMQQKGLFDEAIPYLRESLRLHPDNPEALSILGSALKQKGSVDEAIALLYKAIQLDPQHVQARLGLAAALVEKWRLDEATDMCNAILKMNEHNVLACYILGNILMTQGKLDEAELFFRRAIRTEPDEVKPFQALLMLTSYHPNYTPQALFYEHLQFAERFEKPLRSTLSLHTNDRTVTRRLKIGYVSPDFKSHAVACFIEPALLSHNKALFELFCYSDVSAPDEVTGRIKGHADQWRTIAGMSDEKVAELIRRERIDILIDLAGHTGGINRILMFARKPAPIQISWIGYPATTGLSAMDYKIVDGFTDPPGMTEQFYTEKLLRLPETFLCYLPVEDSPAVGILPALLSGHITFGSFNNFVKVTPEVIALWARILTMVPHSRLIMKSFSFSDKTTRAVARNLFIKEGVEEERIELLQPVPSVKDHLKVYNQIDIGLDTFPYNGTTTTCEAMWMGVPVVTLAGDTPASRVGLSLLSNAGLKELIGTTYEEYVDSAVSLAGDTKRLQSLREGLRDIMVRSPLTNARQFTLALENLYRAMWKDWCAVSSPPVS